jgi:hypothetical protein
MVVEEFVVDDEVTHGRKVKFCRNVQVSNSEHMSQETPERHAC